MTIDGIVYVVDPGFAKVKSYNPRTGSGEFFCVLLSRHYLVVVVGVAIVIIVASIVVVLTALIVFRSLLFAFHF